MNLTRHACFDLKLNKISQFLRCWYFDLETRCTRGVILVKKSYTNLITVTVVVTFHDLIICSIFQGDLVYVNYGRPEDFKVLLDKGVNCSGKIVIARYGHVFRGDKVEIQWWIQDF